MCAVGATGPDVYGLFVDGASDQANPTPSLHWDYIGTLMDTSGTSLTVDALASRDGFTIVVSGAPFGKFSMSSSGQIYVMNSGTGNVSIMDMDPALEPLFATAIVLISRSEAYAITSLSRSFPDDPTPTIGQVIRWDGVRWRPTAKLPIPPDMEDPYVAELYGITADLSRTPPVVFVISERHVWVTADRGTTWMGASQGLPRAIQCADIRWIKDSLGSRLYLSTYGRSVWVGPQTVG